MSIFQFDDVKVSELGYRYDQLQSLKQKNEETDAQFIQRVVTSICMFPLASTRQNKIINSRIISGLWMSCGSLGGARE
jgi:hypothetical protein